MFFTIEIPPFYRFVTSTTWKKIYKVLATWHILIIPQLRRLIQEDHKLEAILGFISRSFLKIITLVYYCIPISTHIVIGPHNFFSRQSHIDQVGFKLLIPLPPSPECWDNRHVPPGWFTQCLEIKPRLHES